MRISSLHGLPASLKTPLLVVPCLDGVPLRLPRPLQALAERVHALGDIKSEPGSARVLYPDSGVQRLALVGGGGTAHRSAELLRRVAAAAVQEAEVLKQRALHLLLPAAALRGVAPFAAGRAVAEGLVLGAYQYRPPARQPRKDRSVAEVTLVLEGSDGEFDSGIGFGTAAAEAMVFARDLANQPGNLVTPARLASEARGLARKGIKVRVLGERDMQRLKMGALLGVARGSDQEAQLIVLDYAPAGARETLCFVGKGLTFDAGGISIKPAAKMDEMRYDMCGGAAVLGVFHALSRVRPQVRVVGVVPASENLLGGSAQKPGDVVRACDGTTIEVLNTDAEGRLILCDAIAWARKTYKPDAIVDLATLTGAVVVALGHELTAVLGNKEDWVQQLVAAGKAADEPLWPLPLHKEHLEQMKSKFADLKNINGSDQGGGTIAGAAFLAHFVGDTPWAHLDIAGTAWGGRRREYHRGGASGVGIRLLLELLRTRGQGRRRTS